MCQGGKPDTGKFHSSYIGMNACGSVYENGCVVDGTILSIIISNWFFEASRLYKVNIYDSTRRH